VVYEICLHSIYGHFADHLVVQGPCSHHSVLQLALLLLELLPPRRRQLLVHLDPRLVGAQSVLALKAVVELLQLAGRLRVYLLELALLWLGLGRLRPRCLNCLLRPGLRLLGLLVALLGLGLTPAFHPGRLLFIIKPDFGLGGLALVAHALGHQLLDFVVEVEPQELGLLHDVPVHDGVELMGVQGVVLEVLLAVLCPEALLDRLGLLQVAHLGQVPVDEGQEVVGLQLVVRLEHVDIKI
jgi:hypothetical protein